MKNFKLELFNFKNNLNIDQLDVSNIIQKHLENYDYLSEMELHESLNTNLNNFRYDDDVKLFLENIENEIENNSLVMEIKDLYKKVERQNNGSLYTSCLVKLLEIVNKDDDDTRMEMILNELVIYDWIPNIKHFLLKMTTNPIERENLKNSGKGEKVYTVVEGVDDGTHVAYILDRWFLISEDCIKQVNVDDYVKDANKIRNIRLLENVLKLAEIDDNKISLKIDENLTLGISTKNKDLYLNGEKLDKETTIETLFNSSIIPYMKKSYYNLVEAIINNLDKFVDLDLALKVTNILNPHLECVVFNYKDNMYMYSKDNRTGSKFYTYENAMELVHDVQKEIDYDLTNFYENKISTELKDLRKLEDKEQKINIKLNDVNESIYLLNMDKQLLNESSELKTTYNNLMVFKDKLTKELNVLKNEKNKARKCLLK